MSFKEINNIIDTLYNAKMTHEEAKIGFELSTIAIALFNIYMTTKEEKTPLLPSNMSEDDFNSLKEQLKGDS